MVVVVSKLWVPRCINDDHAVLLRIAARKIIGRMTETKRRSIAFLSLHETRTIVV